MSGPETLPALQQLGLGLKDNLEIDTALSTSKRANVKFAILCVRDHVCIASPRELLSTFVLMS